MDTRGDVLRKKLLALSRCVTLMAPRMSIIFLSAALACWRGFSEIAVAAEPPPPPPPSQWQSQRCSRFRFC